MSDGVVSKAPGSSKRKSPTDLVYEGERIGKGDGYRFETLIQRTGADYEIELAITVTPLGAISRLGPCRSHHHRTKQTIRLNPIGVYVTDFDWTAQGYF